MTTFLVRLFCKIKKNIKRNYCFTKHCGGKEEASTADGEILNCMIFRSIPIFNLFNVLCTNGDSIILLPVRASTCNLLLQLIVVDEERSVGGGESE